MQIQQNFSLSINMGSSPRSTSLLDQAIPILPLNKSDERIAAILDTFSKSYGAQPSFFCKSPGRVNLIGFLIEPAVYS